MSDDTLIEDLVIAGVAPSLIGRVANALVSASVRGQSADAVDAKRAKDAARKRAAREEAKKLRELAGANDAANRVANQSDGPDASADASDKRCDLSSFLSKESGKPNKEERKNRSEIVALGASKRGTRISPSWQPSDEDFAFARDNGMALDAIDRLRAEFVDYWIGVPGQRGLKLNWSATWRNRVRAVAGKTRTGNGRPANPVMEAFDRRIAGTAGAESQGHLELRDVTPGRFQGS